MAYNYEYPYTDPCRYNSDWLLNKMRELSVEWAKTRADWITQQNAFNDLKNYIDNYFNNLDLSQEVSNKIDEMYNNGLLSELISNLKYLYFENKHICIIGDSISDNSTNPPNWTIDFTNEVSKVGATVTNVSRSGSSFAGWANDQHGDLSSIPTADIYIVFLGINDFQGQHPWTGGVTAYEAEACAKAVFGHVISLNQNADYYYVSPIKILRPEVQKYGKPLIYYRALYESIASSMGFTVISGYNAPQLSAYNPSKLSDTLHPTSSYGTVLSRYILNAMLSGVSTFTPFTRLTLDSVFQPKAGNGYCVMTADSNFNVQIHVTVNNYPIQAGWNTICTLNDALTTFTELDSTTVYNPGSDKHYQVQLTADGLQIYATAPETVNLSFVVKWANRWNGMIKNE